MVVATIAVLVVDVVVAAVVMKVRVHSMISYTLVVTIDVAIV